MGKPPDFQGGRGEARKYLKVFETLARQLLNAYGAANYARLSAKELWPQPCQPLNSGAVFMHD